MSFHRLGRRGGWVLVFAWVFASLLSSLAGSAAQPAKKSGEKKLPIPDKKAQLTAATLIGELYREDLVKSLNDNQARLRLAQTFLLEARDTNDDAAGKYVLLSEAAQLAAKAGDVSTALQAIEELAGTFEIDAGQVLRQKLDALEVGSKAANLTKDAYHAVVDAALVLMEEAVAEDDFDTALALGATADSAAKKTKMVALASSVRQRNEEVRTMVKEFAKVKPFVETLKKNPKDAEANYEAGKYYALYKGNWDKGLPLLARGSNAALKKLAALDLAEPQKGKEQRAVADGWLDEAKQLKDIAHINTLLRSYRWYQQAVGHLDDKDRLTGEAAMTLINNMLPPEYRIGEIVTEIKRLEGHTGPVYSVAFSADGRKLVSGGADGSVRWWDAKTGKEQRRFDGHNGPVWTVAVSPTGQRIMSGGFDRTIRLWDPVSGKESKQLAGHDDYVRSVAFSGDGRVALSGGDDRLVKVWDPITGTVRICRGHDHFVFGMAITRDGKRGLSASLDKTVRYWDLESGDPILVLTGHTDTVLAVAFSPDGRRALSGSTDKTVRVWDLKTGSVLHTLKGHGGYVHSVAFSPDGRRALSAGQDGKLYLWDVDTGKLLRTLEGHSGAVWSVAFSQDGRFAASAGNDGTVRLWGSGR
jgi:WD40 repeat protein